MDILGCGLGWAVKGHKSGSGSYEQWLLTLGESIDLNRPDGPEHHRIPPGLAKVIFIGYKVLSGLAEGPFSPDDQDRILDAWGLSREKDFRGVEVHRV